jgi:sulfide dehydrogenase cytochrome subunit
MRYAILAATALVVPVCALAQGAPPTAEICATCHGEAAPSPFPDVPTIHGLPEVVIENALYDFRGHTRPCRKPDCATAGRCPDMDMCAVAGPMKHDDMEAVATWYEAQAWAPAGEPFNATLVEQGKLLHAAECEICHTAGGTDPLDQASILRGQRSEYLRRAISDYREGRRMAVAAMDAKMKVLSDEDVNALIAYYASPVGDGG